MAYDFLLHKVTSQNIARGDTPTPLPLVWTGAERQRLALLEPSTRTFVVEIIGWARDRGIPAQLGETWRSQDEQDKAIKEGKSGIKEEGRIGWHQVGRAFHLVIMKPDRKTRDRDAYRIVGEEVRRRGGEWLGDVALKTRTGTVEDLAHYEYHPGITLAAYRKSPLATRELTQADRRARKYA